MADDKVQISAMVPPALRVKLQHAAIDEQRSQSEIVADALTDYFAKHQP